jgi:hypothetical protein
MVRRGGVVGRGGGVTGTSNATLRVLGTRTHPLGWRAECLRGPAAANGGAGQRDAPGAVAGLIGPQCWRSGGGGEDT